jgi:hypothetical protein
MVIGTDCIGSCYSTTMRALPQRPLNVLCTPPLTIGNLSRPNLAFLHMSFGCLAPKYFYIILVSQSFDIELSGCKLLQANNKIIHDKGITLIKGY